MVVLIVELSMPEESITFRSHWLYSVWFVLRVQVYSIQEGVVRL